MNGHFTGNCRVIIEVFIVRVLAIDDFAFEVGRNFSACTDRLATPTGG